jgi:hypothetical protein
VDGSRGRPLIQGESDLFFTQQRLWPSRPRADYKCRYNMTYITRQAALNGKPILGVSINYRVAAFGFLDSEEVRVSLALSYVYAMRMKPLLTLC